MRALLAVKSCAHCITERLAANASAEAKATDAKALGHLLLHMSAQYIDLVSDKELAYDVWTTLEVVFKNQSKARKQQLRLELLNIRKREDEPVTLYFSRALRLAKELKHAGLEWAEDDVLTMVLW